MDICIHRKYIGYNNHIVISGDKFQQVTRPPENCYIIGALDAEYPGQSADFLLKLNGFSVPKFPAEKYVKSMSYVTNKKDLPWVHIIPKKQYIAFIKELVTETEKLIQQSKEDYYKNTYCISREVLKALQPAKINKSAWMRFMLMEKNLSNKSTLKTFETQDGWLKVPEYDRDTKTGRLRIVSGPNILRLKKEYRSILKSRFGENGSLYYLDYKSLEPRTVLAINKPNQVIPLDIYSYVLKELDIKTVSRNDAKTTIISQIYGANEENIELKNVENSKDFIKLVSQYFGVDSLRQHLMTEVKNSERNGFYNDYGRWIDCADAKPYMLINYYIQSTAVDIAMIGFKKIIDLIMNSEYKDFIIPLFDLHDAIILDVENRAKPFLDELIEAGSVIEQFPNVKFYLESSQLK
jgi:hypothetical protein